MAVTPKDAAAIVLLKDGSDPKVFWVKRSPHMNAFGGFHSFPGGQLDAEDCDTIVSELEPGDEAAMRACAVREFFEETGVLLARGVESLSPDEIRAKRAALKEGAGTFKQILEEDRLEISGSRLISAGRWVTPPFAPRRFDTWFFLSWLPEEQEAIIETGELEEGEWVRLREAYDRWKRGEILLAPPTLHIIKTLAENADRLDRIASALTMIPESNRGMVRRIEIKPGILMFPVKTPTLPPATHTNCYIIGGKEVIVIDPASPYEEEQRELDSFIDGLLGEGRSIREILITHHHSDHTGGVNHLRERLGVPVAAHRLTAERVAHSITVDRFIEDDEIIELEGDPAWRVRALHTPGHTRGHLCFFEERNAVVLTGDLVAGIGTIVIDPPEGNMRQYMKSLERLLALPGRTSLFPAHGPAIGHARGKLEQYIHHRMWREEKIFAAVEAGATRPTQIVEAAYTDVSPAIYGLAERSAVAHLEKLEEEGRVASENGRYRAIQ